MADLRTSIKEPSQFHSGLTLALSQMIVYLYFFELCTKRVKYYESLCSYPSLQYHFKSVHKAVWPRDVKFKCLHRSGDSRTFKEMTITETLHSLCEHLNRPDIMSYQDLLRPFHFIIQLSEYLYQQYYYNESDMPLVLFRVYLTSLKSMFDEPLFLDDDQLSSSISFNCLQNEEFTSYFGEPFPICRLLF